MAREIAGSFFAVSVYVLFAIAVTSVSHAQQEDDGVWPAVPGLKSNTLSTLKDHLENLVRMVDESELAYVVRADDSSVAAYTRSEGHSTEAEIKKPENWLELMSRTNILSVDKSDTVYTFVPLGQPIPVADDRAELVWYEFSEHLPANSCAPEYEEMTCGLCELGREGYWSIRFSWSSGPHVQAYNKSVEEISQLLLDGEITSQEWSTRQADYFSEMFRSDQECISRGLEDLGLENPSDYF